MLTASATAAGGPAAEAVHQSALQQIGAASRQLLATTAFAELAGVRAAWEAAAVSQLAACIRYGAASKQLVLTWSLQVLVYDGHCLAVHPSETTHSSQCSLITAAISK